MARVAGELEQGHPDYFRTFAPPKGSHRRSAVLMLFGPGADGEEVVLTERSAHLRSHPGQVSFPGGSLERGDVTAADGALREAREEVGIDPAGVDVSLQLPDIFLSPSQHAVTPVLAWWPIPGEVRAADPIEVARAAKVRVAELVDPDRRFTVTHPSGYRGPGFEVEGLFVWGFTAMLLSTLLDVAGVAPPWDESVERELPERLGRPWSRG